MATYITPLCGTSDDTAAVQAAIDTGFPVLLPAGYINIRSLDLTNKQGAVLKGCGILATNIIPLQSGVNVIDVTGSSNTTLSDFHISGATVPTISPSVGILNAQPAASYSSDVTLIERVRVDGYFGTAAWYNLGVASSAVSFAQFYNYTAGGQVAILTGNNGWGAVSHFTTIDNSNNHMPSDWTLTQVELHNLGSGGSLWIGGANSIRFFGGNMSSSGIPVSINAVVTGSGSVAYPSQIIFDGTTFYNDFAPAPPRAITNNAGPACAPIMRGNQSSFPLL